MRQFLGIVFVCLTLLLCIEAASRQDDRGPRPQLIKNRVAPLSGTVSSDYQEYLLTTLEFDQDVYVNDPFLCAGQEEDCTPSNCVPCDWSGENPTGCDNVNCCGAAQWPQFPASNHTSDWCDSSLPSYTKLEFDEPSDRFTLSKGEYKYFRFFVGEEQFCRSIHVEVTTHLGDTSLHISNLVAYPNQHNLKKIENGQQFEASAMGRVNPNAQFGNSVMTICPNVNPAYDRGTFSIAISGFQERNDATVTLYLGEDRYPIPPPEDRIRCDDLPDDIYYAPPLSNGWYTWSQNVCLEEGVTSEVDVLQRQWIDVVLPVRQGCQEISFSFNGFTNTNTDPNSLPDANILINCGQSGSNAYDYAISTLITRDLMGWDTWYLSACFDEDYLLHCNILNQYESGTSKMYWSSESKPIRHKISEVDPAMLTTYYGRGAAGAIEPSLEYEGKLDWGFYGFSSITQPTNDPLIFYPPAAAYGYDYPRDPLEVYVEAGFTETKSNIVNIVDLTYKEEKELRSRDVLLESGFVYVLGITSATGMPVELCSDEDLESGKCERGSGLPIDSWTDFMTTRTISSLNVVDNLNCNSNNYYKLNDLVQREVEGGLESSDFDSIARKAFVVDLYNAGLTRTACVLTMENVLSTEVENVTKLERRFCEKELGTEEYTYDPCCDQRAGAGFCCRPTVLTIEDDLYTGNDLDVSELSCKHSDCDDSFFSDIATSLNALGNPVTGCATGIPDPEYQLRVLIEKSMADFIRPCLISSGYGDTFEGVECSSQEDCAFLDTTCDMTEGRCRMQSAQEARNNYFECFFDNMPPMLEDYIRMNVLSVVDNDYPKDSKYFKAVVREAATQYDCLGLNPFDLSYGERWAADAALYCKGEGLGFQDLGQMEAHEDEINEICPEFLCLGESTCRWEIAKRCKTPLDRFGCFDNYHKLIAASESSCPVDESVCSVTSTLSSSCEGDEYQCVVCLSEWDSCTLVEGVDTEEECARLVACEVPGGGMRYDLTEEQCLNLGECSSLCDGQSCRSVDGLKGTCVVEGASDCESIGGSEFEGVCILETVKNTYACDQASLELSMTTQWYTCESMDIDECNDYVNFTAPYKHLRCFVDRFRSCDNEDECLATGTCSDIEVARNVNEDPVSGWFSVSYGTCLSSGTIGTSDVEEPYPIVSVGEAQFTYGCYYKGVSQFFCEFLSSPNSFLKPYWTNWITPARNETECRQEVQGRFGCALPKNYEKTFWTWNRTDCECKQGYSDYFFTWTDGSWEHGIAHPLTWTQKELRPKYTWENALSLVKMESWVRNAVEGAFVFALKSQLVCEGNYVSSSLTTLVCDCVEDGSETCYNSNIETEVGVSLACAGASSILKGPSSYTNFSETSINDLCTESSLYLIQSSWFQFPRSPPSVSFQFAERKEKGVVVNRNGAEVGEVMGDGSHIVFQNPDRVKHFETCLLISKDEDLYANDYPRRDFGVPVDDFRSIQPLGLENIREETQELFVYWCANITSNDWSGEGVALFPIVTMEDYEDEEEDFLSHRTESLLYTLAACYIFDLVIVLLFLIVMIQKSLSAGKSLPLIAYLGFFLAFVCIFRIVFCFVYIDDGFSELSEYVVFEIPTFLLFTGVIWVLILFMQLSKKNTFDFRSQDKGIWGVGFLVIFIVWSLFIIVTIVYSEVILEETDESVCPGRVQSDNEEIEDDTRTLSIVYQTIVIFLTLLFAVAFGYQARKLFNMSKNSGTKAKVFIFRLGAITVTSFLLRCVLFIILLASDITSDIYLFITLLLTEVLMILLISLELNKGFYSNIAGVISAKTGSTLGGTGSGSKTSDSKGSVNYSYSDEK